MNTTKKKLPIGIQNFSKIRSDNYYYVDKTGYAIRLANEGSYYFLSRPRRFGKSLFLDTLAEMFAGNKELFTGLVAEKEWDWSKKYPVIRISFGSGISESREKLDRYLKAVISNNARSLKLPVPENEDSNLAFSRLIQSAYEKYSSPVVLLVDEYDKPILDNITEKEKATEMRNGLRNFYSVIKDNDPYLRFVFLTGVSKFSKVSIFSGLNNLNDITIDSKYSAICGYTNEDIDTVFAPELEGIDRERIRKWYNGYSWLGEKVYNPFDILLLFDKRSFRPYWFETGTPTFLIELLKTRKTFIPKLDRLIADEQLLSAFDVDHISTEALLWQTGYLTIVETNTRGSKPYYTLSYPNLEVKSALNDVLLKSLYYDMSEATRATSRLADFLYDLDFDGLKEHFKSFFGSIPVDWYRKNDIAHFEGYWASLFYSHLASLGLDLTPEDVTNLGKIDLTVNLPEAVIVVEFKMVEGDKPTGKALEQIKRKNYADKYRSTGKPIYLLGIEFSESLRNVIEFRVEKA